MVVVLFLASGDLIIFLFTNVYSSSIPVFRVWLLSFLLVSLQPHGVLRAYGDTRFLAIHNVLKLLIVAVLIQGFVSAFGLTGAVGVTVLALFAGKCMLLFRLKRLSGATLSRVLPWRSLAGIAAMSVSAALPLLALRYNFDWPILVRLVSLGATYAVGYAFLSWLFIWRAEKCADLFRFGRLTPKSWSATTVGKA
jgi:O-antigen/teichoic acid export membrane protein